MPPVLVPLIEIELDKVRHLRFDLNAFALAEELTGKTVIELGVFSARDVRALLYAGLRHEDPDITLEQAGAMVCSDNLSRVVEKLAKAWTVAQPAATPEEKGTDGQDPLANAQSAPTG